MSKKENKIFRKYMATAADISTEIMINIRKNGGAAPNLEELTGLVSSMVNDFSEKVLSYERKMEEKDHEESLNTIRENLLSIGNKYESFISSEKLVYFSGQKIAELLILTREKL